MNYDNNNEKIIRDSYSAFGLNKDKLIKYFSHEKHDYQSIGQLLEQDYPGLCEEVFSASVNVGVSEYELYKNFIAKLESKHIPYRLLGRYDVAIVNDAANLAWIMYMQYLLNCAEGEPFFSNYETFVKIPMPSDAEFRDGGNNPSNFLQSVCKHLEPLKEKFLKALQDRTSYDGQYELPLCAVINSIKSISGNGFAEDFVLCMYQPFHDFILYLTEKLSDQEENMEEEFDKCYSEFFKGLNSLVNSAMHSERQFIQATAFNAIIYDIPPKIMAFYVAMINDLQKIVHTDTDKKYTFFLTPSFANQISVEIFSYKEEVLPHDRLIMVTLNEESLFNPRSVIREMAHEIAHFEGDGLRRRSDRKESIKLVLVYMALSKILYTSFLGTPSFIKLGEEVCDLLNENIVLNNENLNYSDELLGMGEAIYLEFRYNQKIQELLKEYVKSCLKQSQDNDELFVYLKEIEKRYMVEDALGELDWEKISKNPRLDILTNLIMVDIRTAIEYLNTEEEIAIKRGEADDSVVTKLNDPWGILGEAARVISSIYSEVFADMHMVLLTGISYAEYLNGFVEDAKIDIGQFCERQEDHVRMSAVSLIMYIAGIWEDVLDPELKWQSNIADLHELLRVKNCFMCNTIKDWVKDNKKLQTMMKNVYNSSAALCRNIDGSVRKRPMFSLDHILGKADREASCNQGITYNFDEFPALNEKIFVYLLKCMADALKHYDERQTEILEIRETMDTVFEFCNVETVFSTICAEIKRYKKILSAETRISMKDELVF